MIKNVIMSRSIIYIDDIIHLDIRNSILLIGCVRMTLSVPRVASFATMMDENIVTKRGRIEVQTPSIAVMRNEKPVICISDDVKAILLTITSELSITQMIPR